MTIMTSKTSLVCCALLGLGFYQSATASEADDLEHMLQHFLANASLEAAHASFWAEDLVYSSSAGLRFGKAEIMGGFTEDEPAEAAQEEEPAIVYTGEEVDVRLYGDTAVVAFKLVGTPADGSTVFGYYNTGTFLKRNGVWRVVAWQATKIP